MLSKLLAPNAWGGLRYVGFLRPPPPVLQPKSKIPSVRHAGHLIPPSQYDIPMSPKFKLTYALAKYWELIPMFLTVCTSMLILVLAIIWAVKNKVDVVYTSHSRDSISRTMDLRNPSIHKILIINQRYEPWDDMQRVLDRMKYAEKRELARARGVPCYPHA